MILIHRVMSMSESNPIAYKYIVPISEDSIGNRHMLVPAVGQIPLEPDDLVFMYYTPDQNYATLYRFKRFMDIATWLADEQRNRDKMDVLDTPTLILGVQSIGIDITTEIKKRDDKV